MGAQKRCRMHKYLRLGIIYCYPFLKIKAHSELRRSKNVDHRPLFYYILGGNLWET